MHMIQGRLARCGAPYDLATTHLYLWDMSLLMTLITVPPNATLRAGPPSG